MKTDMNRGKEAVARMKADERVWASLRGATEEQWAERISEDPGLLERYVRGHLTENYQYGYGLRSDGSFTLEHGATGIELEESFGEQLREWIRNGKDKTRREFTMGLDVIMQGRACEDEFYEDPRPYEEIIKEAIS